MTNHQQTVKRPIAYLPAFIIALIVTTLLGVFGVFGVFGPSGAFGASQVSASGANGTDVTNGTDGTIPKELVVAGAADLRPAFEEIGKLFSAQTGSKVTFSFGSSGQLAQQIANGAPFDVFASADVSFVDKVLSAGIGDASTKATYAFGRLALWLPSNVNRKIAEVKDLTNSSIQRIAIANPDHAPYGRAAVQSLKSTKVYSKVSNRLVFGENVSDAYRLATSGNADAALVSLSLVIADNHNGRYTIIPASAHKPLEQAIVVTATKARSPLSKSFVAIVTSPAGRAVMRKYGFLLRGEPIPTTKVP